MTSNLPKILPLLLLTLFLGWPLAGCDPGSGPAKSQKAESPKPAPASFDNRVVLAEIDNRRLTGADLKKYLGLFKESEKIWTSRPEEREKLINHLIDRELLLEEARKQGYFKIDDLKKHGHLKPGEGETIALRAYLNDKIARPATPGQAAIDSYLKQHPGLSRKEARERVASAGQSEIFKKLMARLRRGRKIVIHGKQLARLPAAF